MTSELAELRSALSRSLEQQDRLRADAEAERTRQRRTAGEVAAENERLCEENVQLRLVQEENGKLLRQIDFDHEELGRQVRQGGVGGGTFFKTLAEFEHTPPSRSTLPLRTLLTDTYPILQAKEAEALASVYDSQMRTVYTALTGAPWPGGHDGGSGEASPSARPEGGDQQRLLLKQLLRRAEEMRECSEATDREIVDLKVCEGG